MKIIDRFEIRASDLYLVIVESLSAMQDKEKFAIFSEFMKRRGGVTFSYYSFTFDKMDDELIDEIQDKCQDLLLENECVMVIGPIPKEAKKIGLTPLNTNDVKLVGGGQPQLS